MKNNRRNFIRQAGQLAFGLSLFSMTSCEDTPPKATAQAQDSPPEIKPPWNFDISLAQWSLHRRLKGGEMDNLDFAAVAREEFGLSGVEYVNQFFMDKAKDRSYLGEMKKRAADNGVKSLLIMVDGEGYLGDLEASKRKKAVENHFKWMDAALLLGCHSIRVNAAGEGSREEVAKAAAEGLRGLAELGEKIGLNVIVENHGGYSSDGAWLSGIMQQINMPNCGTLPDFGNFCIQRSDEERWEDQRCLEEYDRYLGVQQLMPFAKAVSAKSNDFDEKGNEMHTDYMRVMQTVKEAGYSGWVGIEYEGNQLSEAEGIKATKALLEKVRDALR